MGGAKATVGGAPGRSGVHVVALAQNAEREIELRGRAQRRAYPQHRVQAAASLPGAPPDAHAGGDTVDSVALVEAAGEPFPLCIESDGEAQLAVLDAGVDGPEDHPDAWVTLEAGGQLGEPIGGKLAVVVRDGHELTAAFANPRVPTRGTPARRRSDVANPIVMLELPQRGAGRASRRSGRRPRPRTARTGSRVACGRCSPPAARGHAWRPPPLRMGDPAGRAGSSRPAGRVRSRSEARGAVRWTTRRPPRVARAAPIRGTAPLRLTGRACSSSVRSITLRMTTRISSRAKPAPRQRRVPPPNGSQEWPPGGLGPRKRSGTGKALGSG